MPPINTALLSELLQTNLPALITETTRQINERNAQTLDYRHKVMLTVEYSVSGYFESLHEQNKAIAADLVALDSKAPVKSRGSVGRASGYIPKASTAYSLNERQIQDINTLAAVRKGEVAEVFKRLANDTPRVIRGLDELAEEMFLSALSSGYTLTGEVEGHDGIGARIDFGYLDDNKLKVTKKWSEATSNPLEDMRRVISKAKEKGYQITNVFMDLETFQQFVTNDNVKAFVYARSIGAVAQNVAMPAPSLQELNRFIKADTFLGFEIEVIDRRVRVERAGKEQVIKPWEDGMVIFTTSRVVGKLVWSDVAEDSVRNPATIYEKADTYKLISIKRTDDPLGQKTIGQARFIPVITGVDGIFQLDTTKTK